MAEAVYDFPSHWSFCKQGARVCLAREAFVTEFIARSEFDELFGGHILAESPDGTAYIGVWDRRVCGRFRQTLRDRGAVIDVVHEQPEVRVRVWGYRSHAKK